jgi:multiple sugar transport system permease protein
MFNMKEITIKRILTFSGVTFVLLFCLVPLIFMLAVSIADRADFFSAQVNFKITTDNYKAILTDKSLHFFDYMRNSVIVSFGSASMAVLLASIAAYAISRLRIPCKIGLMMMVLAASMIPQIAMVGYLFKILAAFKSINTYRSLILPYIAIVEPLALWVLVSYFSQIPKELDEAALVDGCSRWQVLWKIIFPVAIPAIFSVFLLAFIFSFNEFIFALMFTTSYQAHTIPVGISLFEGLHGQTPWGNIMAAAAVSVMPMILLVLIFERKIIGGLTLGAVKG